MDPNKSASAPPPGWNADDKSGMGYAAPPPYQDYPQYPNAGFQQPGQAYPPPPQGYGPPPQPYGAAPYGQAYPAGPGQYPAGPGQYPPPPGTQGATVTVQPTVFVTRPPLANPVNDYLGYSIFTMLCCCLPLGIAALIYSISTRDANLSGDQIAAERDSKNARILNHVAVGIGLIITIICITYTRDSNLAGNLQEAQRSSDLARKFNHAAVAIGLILAVCTIIFMSL